MPAPTPAKVSTGVAGLPEFPSEYPRTFTVITFTVMFPLGTIIAPWIPPKTGLSKLALFQAWYGPTQEVVLHSAVVVPQVPPPAQLTPGPSGSQNNFEPPTVYVKTVAQLEVSQSPQPPHVPLFAKISGPPPEC